MGFFTGDPRKGQDTFVIDSDGSNPTNLTNHPAENMYPIWSPDGTFVSSIGIMDADGSNPTNVTDGRVGRTEAPDWIPQ